MRNLKIVFALVFATVFMLTSCQKDALETATPENQKTTEQLDSENVFQLTAAEGESLLTYEAEKAANAAETTAINLKLENGNELQFFKTGESDDDIAVIEIQKCTSCSVSALDFMSKQGTDEYTAKDIYWAYSEAGAIMPFKMAQQKALLAVSNVGIQGWARKELQRANENEDNTASSRSSIACNNTSFRNSISGGFLDFDTFVKYDLLPRNNFTKYCFEPGDFDSCIGGDRYKYKAWWTSVRRWAGKVCAKSVQTSYNNHNVNWCGPKCSADPNCNNSYYCTTYFGPTIKFERYDNGRWKLLRDGSKVASYEIPPNERWTYGWWSRSSTKKSYRVRLEAAKGYDEFDVMMDADNRR